MNRQGFDYNNLLKEAQVRWLKPAEIHYILQNHERYPVASKAPQQPPSGSLFLFNKRVLRYFRKDGHNWRKKKDGKNVGEAHERLKVGNADALNCYYAHGEQNPYFQRRSYWMLDPAYEHIVLVHYREVSEGRFLSSASISKTSPDSFSTFNQSPSSVTAPYEGLTSGTGELYDPNGSHHSPGTVEEVSLKYPIGIFDADHLNTIDDSRASDLSPQQDEVGFALRRLAVQLSLEDADNESVVYFGEKLPAFSGDSEKSQEFGLLDNKTHENLLRGTEYWKHYQFDSGKQDFYSNKHFLQGSGDNKNQGSQSLGSGPSGYNVDSTQSHLWNLSSSSAPTNAHGRTSNFVAPPGVLDSSISRLSAQDRALHFPFEQQEQFAWPQLDHIGNNAEERYIDNPIQESGLNLQPSATREFLYEPENPISQFSNEQMQSNSTGICETTSNMPKFRKQISTDWMANIDLDVTNSTYTSDFSEMWFDQGQFDIPLREDSSLTVAEKQRFSIREISPEWAFSSESTKVIIIGDFLCNSSECSWAIMFGDTQVPAEIVQDGVLRCTAPQHHEGKVTLCVTSGNRESCSEIRDFEFRAKPTVASSPKGDPNVNSEELLLLIKLVRMLLYGSDGFLTFNSDALINGSEAHSGALDWIIQALLKDKLQRWLSPKHQGEEFLMSKQDQGIIHMISGLGYEWALNPILDAGVGINFRDANGWTALHWAARFGREEMAAALLASGASPGAVTDATRLDPVGKTAGAIAAANGHTGLAGYLSEADLTDHLSLLTMGENEISKGSAEVEAEAAVESISQRSYQMHVGSAEDDLSLKDSLAAVRNATQAAARIQAAFRAHSFRKRHEIDRSVDEYGLTPGDVHGLSSSSKYRSGVHGSRDQKFDKAALSIQKKYRGWKWRKEFLTLRHHVVKIQAHVRGFQERKKYKEIMWTVGVLEKAVLRWRRKGVGFRGYRPEPELIDEEDQEVEDVVKVFRKKKVDAALDQAVSRVLSVVESPTARQQYRRMLGRYPQAKAESTTSDEATSKLKDDFEIIESNEFMN